MNSCRVVDLVIGNLVKKLPKNKLEERAALEAEHETWRCEREAKALMSGRECLNIAGWVANFVERWLKPPSYIMAHCIVVPAISQTLI
jgi:hypothetical protein